MSSHVESFSNSACTLSAVGGSRCCDRHTVGKAGNSHPDGGSANCHRAGLPGMPTQNQNPSDLIGCLTRCLKLCSLKHCEMIWASKFFKASVLRPQHGHGRRESHSHPVSGVELYGFLVMGNTNELKCFCNK